MPKIEACNRKKATRPFLVSLETVFFTRRAYPFSGTRSSVGSLGAAVLVMLLAAAGCRTASAPGLEARPDTSAAAQSSSAGIFFRIEGSSVEGRPLEYRIYGTGPETVLILGGIHGNEPAGTMLCLALCAYLDRRGEVPADRRVVVAPALNPDGLARNQRLNARGVDVNRNFDTRNRISKKRYGMEPLSEPEARFISELIERFEPVRILTFHQPVACVDWDGPAEDLAKDLARAFGLPVRKLGTRPGSLGSYAGVELQIPTITLELPGGVESMEQEGIWERYGEALLTAIR